MLRVSILPRGSWHRAKCSSTERRVGSRCILAEFNINWCCTDICQTSEELSPQDKAAELLPIAVQYLYVLIRQGKIEEAESLLSDIHVEE